MNSNFLFDTAEYEARLAATRARMEAQHLDAIFVIDPNNLYYLTGYSAMSNYVPQGVLITASTVQAVFRGMDVLGARLTTWLSDDQIHGYPDAKLISATDTPWHMIRDMFERHGVANKRIGLDKSGGFISPATWEMFMGLLPNATIVDTTLLVNYIRARKSPKELQFMREAGAISDAALLAGVESINPGVRESDAAGEVSKRLVAGTPEYAGTLGFPLNMPGGKKVMTPHLLWSDDRYQAQDQVNIEVGGMRHWYTSPASRTVVLGKVNDNLKTLEEATQAGMEAVFATARPGETCEGLERAFRTETTKFGFEKESRIGYAVGLGFIPPGWIEFTSSIAPGDKTVLQTGMTYHLMLGMWFEQDSLVLTESFAVTETGCESFCKLPRQLYVKG
ncbi:MAG: M24 family metallopeptidase [Sphingorhabdus sp.]